ncbi:MAG: glycerate kinase [Kiritimatiellae bacterium]|nr:glycerate kinase [Kiritimatiellia bacterium]
MRVLIASNSFKNCLGARAVGEAVARGLRAARPDTITDIIPMSDGGDGLVEALADSLAAERIRTATCDALGRKLKAEWLLTGECAVIEMALASGLARLRGPEEYRPLVTSTTGTGILIRAALDRGCRHIVIGLGGSATVDAGCGMAAALGIRLLTARGRPLPEGGGALSHLARIEMDAADKRLKDTRFTGLIDVQNPLLGANGAARVFAPQKGATPAEVECLESNLAHWAAIVQRDMGKDLAPRPGGGAAGGLGAGCVAFLDATLESGAAWVARQNRLAEAIRQADLVITGEGRLDEQTAFGKVPAFVAQMAQTLGKKVVALGGSVAENLDLHTIGIARCVAVTPPGTPLAAALRDAKNNLANAAATLIMEP